MIAVVPVEDIKAAVGPDFFRYGHEPRVIGRQQIRQRLRQIGSAVAFESIHVQTTAVKVADADTSAPRRRKRAGIEERDATVSGLLMTVVGDRTDRHRKWRIRAG